MTTTITKKNNELLKPLFKEITEIKKYLRELLVIIPEESLKKYKNSSQIKKAYQKAVRDFPPR